MDVHAVADQLRRDLLALKHGASEPWRAVVERIGLSLVDAVTMCATTPARELGLVGHGLLAEDAVADVVVLDARLSVVQTYVAGQLVYSRA